MACSGSRPSVRIVSRRNEGASMRHERRRADELWIGPRRWSAARRWRSLVPAVGAGARALAATIPSPSAAAAWSSGGRQIGGPFTLVDETGETVTDAEVLTKPSLVYFGYTFCPDVCPLDNARNAEAVDAAGASAAITCTPIFISVDPARDTPERAGGIYRLHVIRGCSG